MSDKRNNMGEIRFVPYVLPFFYCNFAEHPFRHTSQRCIMGRIGLTQCWAAQANTFAEHPFSHTSQQCIMGRIGLTQCWAAQANTFAEHPF
ncbi:MAG: hypothetical protein IKI60_00475 [Alloprevotella sp.]|nr:hypothetical protein [Alloprevotella sp.]